MLDLIATITKKAQHISNGSIKIGNDNRILVNAINLLIIKETQFSVGAGAKIARIKEIINNSLTQIGILLIKEQNNNTRTF